MEKRILSKIGFNSTLEITINSEDIDFKDGYGVAVFNRDYRKWDENSLVGGWIETNGDFKGIVDEDLNEILPFKAYNLDIRNFGQGNFIITRRYVGGDGEQRYTMPISSHFRIVDGKAVEMIDLHNSKYRVVNKDSIITNGRLYNLLDGTFSEKFDVIEDFKQVGENPNNLLARAIIFLEYGHELICYIDTEGKISTPLLSSFDGEKLDSNIPGFALNDEASRIKKKIIEDIALRKQLNDELLTNV